MNALKCLFDTPLTKVVYFIDYLFFFLQWFLFKYYYYSYLLYFYYNYLFIIISSSIFENELKN